MINPLYSILGFKLALLIYTALISSWISCVFLSQEKINNTRKQEHKGLRKNKEKIKIYNLCKKMGKYYYTHNIAHSIHTMISIKIVKSYLCIQWVYNKE